MLLSHRDRPQTMAGPLPLSTQTILSICEAYNLSMQDFERIILIDELMYPTIIRKKEEDGRTKNPNKHR